MFTILGVDPGSACTGYAVIAGDGNRLRYIASGTIRLSARADRFARLREIHARVGEVIAEHAPTHFAIENVFYNKNPKSALVLGEARGAAILAATLAELPISEYSPREVKLSVTGNGAAHKSQVSFMVGKILGLGKAPEAEDESDAIAIAMCHAFRSSERVVL